MAKNTKTKLYGGNTVINLGTSLELNIPDPVDDRLVVSAETQIWGDAFQFDGNTAYVYHGMQVYAVDTKTTYMYVGPDRTGGPSKTDVQTKSNWRKLSSPESSVDKVEDNLNKLASAVGVSGTASSDTFGYSAHTTPSFIGSQTTLQGEVIAIENALIPTLNTDENITINSTSAYFDVSLGAGTMITRDESFKLLLQKNDNIEFIISRSSTTTLTSVYIGSKNYAITNNRLIYTGDTILLTKDNFSIIIGNECECELIITNFNDRLHKNIISITKNGIEAFSDLHYDTRANKLTFINTNGKKDIELTGVNLIKDAKYSAETEELIIYYQKSGESTDSEIKIPLSGLITEYKFEYSTSEADFSKENHNVNIKTDRSVSGNTIVYADISTFDCGTY